MSATVHRASHQIARPFADAHSAIEMIADRFRPVPLEADDGWRPPTVSLIVPTLNEERNLPHVLLAIPSVVTELLIVDGGSTDGTVATAQKLRPDAVILVDPRPGKGRALRTGFEHSTGDIIVIIDADGSMDPAEILAFVGALMAGADVAKGTRFIQGAGTDDMGLLRRVGNHGLRLAARAAFGGRYSDLCYGYMAFWRRILPVFDGNAVGFEIETFLSVRSLAAGLRIAEVPSYERRRIHGVSNLRTFRDGWRVLRTIILERGALTRQRSGRGVSRPATLLHDNVRDRPAAELSALG